MVQLIQLVLHLKLPNNSVIPGGVLTDPTGGYQLWQIHSKEHRIHVALIIAPDEFAETLRALVDHKNRTNMPAHLVKLSAIVQAQTDPSTHPLAIKQLIAQGHEQFGMSYVLLAGDASRIPVRHRFIRQPDGGAKEGMTGTYNRTDNYYANLYRPGGKAAGFSDWDENRDGKYNEQIWSLSPATNNPDGVDGYPHVAIGRVPAHTIGDIANYVQKVVEYEEGLRARAINAFSFLCDNDPGLGSRQRCEDVIEGKWYFVQNKNDHGPFKIYY